MLDPSEGFLPPLDFHSGAESDRSSGFVRKASYTGAAAAAAHVGGTLPGSPPVLTNASELTAPSPEAARDLPAIGKTFSLNCNAFDSTLLVQLPPPLPKLNFIGSITLKTLIGGPDSVRLQVLDFALEASHPMFDKITLRLSDVNASPSSILQVSDGGLQSTLLLSFVATFGKCGDTTGPFTFTTLDSAKLNANLSAFPPPPQTAGPDGSPVGGHRYTLAAPIRLGTIDGSGQKTEYAQLQNMHVNLGAKTA